MTGIELLEKYTNRDFSGSADDQYGQLLMTIWSNIHDDIFPLLEKAEAEGKRLDVKDYPAEEALEHEWIVLEDVIFVDKLKL